MPKKVHLPSSTRHILLYDEDMDYLQSRFGPHGTQPVGVSAVVRAIIHQKVLSLRQAEVEHRDAARSERPFRVSGSLAQET